jgi:N-acetyl-anhydromuramyl-L-alanine amidase AmpD
MAANINTSRKSPNRSSRDGHSVRVAILHATVGGLESSLIHLCSPLSRVSSHYVISKAGVVYQLVAETEAAWHAGTAAWMGETAINELSIGIELENRTGMTGFKGQDPYPAAQVQKLTDLARNLISRYPTIAFARHLDVALPKGRKTDPAGFPWTQWKQALAMPPTSPPGDLAPYVLTSPCTPFTARSPSAPLAGVVLQAGNIVNVGDVRDGWLWISDRPDTAPGIGFIPVSYARKV